MARNSRNQGKVVDAPVLVTWAVSQEQFRALSRTGEFTVTMTPEEEAQALARQRFAMYGTETGGSS